MHAWRERGSIFLYPMLEILAPPRSTSLVELVLGRRLLRNHTCESSSASHCDRWSLPDAHLRRVSDSYTLKGDTFASYAGLGG